MRGRRRGSAPGIAHPRGSCTSREYGRLVAQEKGIDVRVALAVVRAVTERLADIVILASHDTDLEPALEMGKAWGDGTVHLETAGWEGCRVLRARGNHLRHTTLGGASFVSSRDRKVYLNPAP